MDETQASLAGGDPPLVLPGAGDPPVPSGASPAVLVAPPPPPPLGAPPRTPRTPSVSAPAPVPVPAPVPGPLKPTMGGLAVYGSGASAYSVPWTGGKPNITWTALEDPHAFCVNPRMNRSNSPKASSSYEARQAGLYPGEASQKFHTGGNLTFFLKKLRAALIDMGMDTITYRRDPLNPKTMVDVLTDYPRLNQDAMLTESLWCKSKFDSYDRGNDLQARRFLLASLSPQLEQEVVNKSDDSDTFVDVLFTFLEEERPQTVDGAQALIEKVKSMSPHDYKNQNVSAYVSAVKPLLENLETARFWDSMHNTHLCRVLANCGGESNQEYSGPLFTLLNQVQAQCKLITHLSNQEKAAHMTKKHLSWRDILKKAESQYKEQTVETQVRWPPACHARDSKAAPASFGAANLTQYDAQRPSGSSGGGSRARNGNRNGNRNGQRNSSRNGSRNGNGGQSDKPKNPKFIPPAPNATPIRHVNGSPVFEKMINGRKFEWCATCKRYSTTHNTGTHVGHKDGSSNGGNGGNGRNRGGGRNNPDVHASLGYGLIPDPSLWLATAQCVPCDSPACVPTITKVSTVDPAVSPNPTWHSVFHDLFLLLGPHALALMIGFCIFGVLSNLDVLFDGLSWFGNITVLDLLTLAAPLLWICLLLVSIYGHSWLAKFNPVEPPREKPQCHSSAPPPNRRQRRHVSNSLKRLKRQLSRRRAAFIRESHSRVQQATDLAFQNAACQVHYGSKHCSAVCPREAPFGHPQFLRRAQEARLVRPLWTRKLNPKWTSRKHYRRKPRRLDLTDPVFRAGLGSKLRSQMNKFHGLYSKFSGFDSPDPDPVPNCGGLVPANELATPSAEASDSIFFGESVLLQHPSACTAAMEDKDSFTIVWDSGASFCVSFDKADFTGPLKTLPKGSCIQGIANHLRIEGVGEVVWSIMDTTGQLRHLKLPCYYIPKLKQRLLSTSVFTKVYPQNPITVTQGSLKVAANPSVPSESAIDVFVNPSNNLPVSTCFRHKALQATASAYNASVSAIHSQNFNLSEPQKELLRWHYRLGHIGFRTVQFIMRTGVLASSESQRRLHTAASRIPHHDLPRCAACQFGRQTNRAVPGKTSRIVKDRSGILSADQLQPGQRVFIDHFVCTTRGRQLRGHGIRDPSGKSPPRGRRSESNCGGCIFVDASSGFVHVEFQSTLSAEDTIRAVTNFEAIARDHGIIVSEYVSDNGSAFTSKAFRAHLFQNCQVSRLSGAGSHHQNGKAERSIRTIMAMARTMLLHSAVHWPDMADPSLWTLAVRHAVWLYNHLPNISTGLSPLDLWSKTRFPLRKLHDLHVFGSPVYVLQKRLSDGKSIGRWEPRSQRFVNLGFSDHHAKTVPLVLNPATGNITSQWNCSFDDWFSTVSTAEAQLPDFNAEEWSRMFGVITSHFPSEEHSLEETPVPQAPTPQLTRSEERADSFQPTPLPAWPSAVAPQPVMSNPLLQPLSSPRAIPSYPSHLSSQEERYPVTVPAPVSDAKTDSKTPSPVPAPAPAQVPAPAPLPIQFSSPSSSAAPSPSPPAAPSPVIPLNPQLKKLADHNNTGLKTSQPLRSKRVRKQTEILNYDAKGGLAASDIQYDLPPHQYHRLYAAAKNKDPDTLSYDEAMAEFEHLQAWRDAALKEIKQLEEKGCWEECLKSEANGAPIIPCTWVFRIKRNPAGDIIKRKGRICLRGDLMDSDEESFAPVCSWTSVRLFLVLAMIMGWKTVSVDWNNAFIQAILDKPIHMSIPRGFKSKYGHNGCVRLRRSLHGSKFAPRNWYMHLRKALLQLGFKESAIDPCLLHKKNILMVLYVDDAGIAAPSRDIIDEFVQQLKDLDFDLDIEDDFNSYLGIGIEEFPDGSRHMTQKGLIKKVIETANMTNCNPNWTPCTQVALGSDPEGELYDGEKFSYASIVGMLLYLSNNTRPDITYAVSQVARFTHSPKKSHAAAVKSIIRYLAKTPDKGIIVKPDGSFNLRCWVDADFSGLHGREPESDSASAKSRYGYLITFAGVPLVWKSQLISEICLSTLHAEYVGLVSAVRALIPIRSLTVEILSFLDLPSSKPVEVHCTLYEDNQGAYLLATNQRITSRTKYFNVKYHFFWSYVYHEEKNPGGWLVIIKCPTDKMNADYLTKGLVRTIFDPNRLRVQGW